MNTLHAEAALKVISGIARKADFEALGIDNVRAIKSDREHPLYRAQPLAAVKDTSDPEERTFTWAGSTEGLDSMGDVLKTGGWDTTRVKTGMCHLLMCHDSYPLPAGLMTKANRNGKLDDGTKCLDLTGRFFELDVYSNSEFGKHVEGARKLTARGDLKGCSVGFIPLEGGFHWPDDKEREELGMPPWGAIYEKQELLELSITAIPANRGAARRKDMRAALKQLVNDGQLEQDTAELLEVDLCASDEQWMRRVQQIGRTVVPVSRTLPWVKGAKDEAPAPTAPVDVNGAVEKAVSAAVDTIVREVSRRTRIEISAVAREILEPIETAITEAADELQLARKDSERAEVSEPRAPNGAKAVTAASTGTSRDNPTNPPPSLSAFAGLKVAIEAANGRADSANAHPRSGQAGSVQDGA